MKLRIAKKIVKAVVARNIWQADVAVGQLTLPISGVQVTTRQEYEDAGSGMYGAKPEMVYGGRETVLDFRFPTGIVLENIPVQFPDGTVLVFRKLVLRSEGVTAEALPVFVDGRMEMWTTAPPKPLLPLPEPKKVPKKVSKRAKKKPEPVKPKFEIFEDAPRKLVMED